MAEAAILERQEQVVASDRLNPKATKEIEALLESSERLRTKRDLADRPLVLQDAPGRSEILFVLIRFHRMQIAFFRRGGRSVAPTVAAGCSHCRSRSPTLPQRLMPAVSAIYPSLSATAKSR